MACGALRKRHHPYDWKDCLKDSLSMVCRALRKTADITLTTGRTV